MENIDILLLCALKDEYDQVINVIDGIQSAVWLEHNDPSGRCVADATFLTEQNTKITIRATWAPHMGRDAIQSHASKIINETQLKCICMSGICAGRRGKVELGDVIFAERLWSYDAGKTIIEKGKEVFQADMRLHGPSDLWIQHMQNIKVSNFETKTWMKNRPDNPYENQELWAMNCLDKNAYPLELADLKTKCPDWTVIVKRLLQRGWIDQKQQLTELGKSKLHEFNFLYPEGLPPLQDFRSHVAPIATGSTVQEDDELFTRLASSMRKVLGVDMEASALSALGEAHGIPVIIAKGVSDFGDTFKDDRYRSFAARASAELLIAFLRKNSNLFITPPIKENSNLEKILATVSILVSLSMFAVATIINPALILLTLLSLYFFISGIGSIFEKKWAKKIFILNMFLSVLAITGIVIFFSFIFNKSEGSVFYEQPLYWDKPPHSTNKKR